MAESITQSARGQNLPKRLRSLGLASRFPEEPAIVGDDATEPPPCPWGIAESVRGPKRDQSIDAKERSERLALRRLEHGARKLVETPNADAARWIREFNAWSDQNITPKGLFLPQPFQTVSLVPPLARLWAALRDRVEAESVESCLKRVVEGAVQTVKPTGAADGIGPSLSSPMAKLVRRLAEEFKTQDLSSILDAMGGKKAALGRGSPQPGFQCDHARAAMLRSDWTRTSPLLAVDLRRDSPRLEATVLGETLFSGPWQTIIAADGVDVAAPSSWDQDCWFSDADGQYLELRKLYGGGIVLERQVFLARRTAAIILADTVKSPRDERLTHTWRLPAPQAEKLEGCFPTRAQRLAGLPFDLRLIPMSLAANPLAPAPGGLSLDGVLLDASTERVGKRLFAALVIAWSPNPLPTQEEWRGLTITNDRRRVAEEEAVAFRVPIGDTQLVFYRSMGKSRRCAFLGHQTLHECVIGAFGKRGKVKEWVTIE